MKRILLSSGKRKEQTLAKLPKESPRKNIIISSKEIIIYFITIDLRYFLYSNHFHCFPIACILIIDFRQVSFESLSELYIFIIFRMDHLYMFGSRHFLQDRTWNNSVLWLYLVHDRTTFLLLYQNCLHQDNHDYHQLLCHYPN